MTQRDLDYELLCRLTSQPEATQRSLAATLGVSVGKVNYCLRALIEKGCVKANNFRRSDNKRAYVYLLTPEGVSAKARLAQAFLARKELEYEQLRREITRLRNDLRAADHPS